MAALLACTAVARPAAQAEVQWHADPAKAHQLARDHQRPLLLLLTTDGCYYCTKMKQSTYRDRLVAADIANHFVAAQVNAKKHRTLARKLGVKAYPTTVIISPDYKVMDVIPGYVDAKTLRVRMANTKSQVRIAKSDPGAGQATARY
jgi:thioredoxin-related protein